MLLTSIMSREQLKNKREQNYVKKRKGKRRKRGRKHERNQHDCEELSSHKTGKKAFGNIRELTETLNRMRWEYDF